VTPDSTASEKCSDGHPAKPVTPSKKAVVLFRRDDNNQLLGGDATSGELLHSFKNPLAQAVPKGNPKPS
jgi:hypothetical protein